MKEMDKCCSEETRGLQNVEKIVLKGIPYEEAQSETAADKWYKVAISGNEVAFVNTGSIQRVGSQVQVRVKQNYLAPVESAKKGRTYQSARTDYRLDCAQRRLAMLETRAFAAPDLQGEVVQKASRSEKNLIWMDAPRASVFGRDPGLRLQARARGLSIDARIARGHEREYDTK